MLIHLVFEAAQEEATAILATTLREDGHRVQVMLADGYSTVREPQGKALTLFLIGKKGLSTSSPMAVVLNQVVATGQQLLVVMMIPGVPPHLPAGLSEEALLVPRGEPVTETAFFIQQRYGRRGLGGKTGAGILVGGAVVLLLAVIWLGFHFAGPGNVRVKAKRIMPEFEITPPVAYAEWASEATFQLVNNNGLANVDYHCEVVNARQSPNIASLIHDDKCAEIRVRTKMGRAGQVTPIGHFNPGEDGLEVRVFDEADSLIWRSLLPFGAMNGIQFEVFEVKGLTILKKGSKGLRNRFQAVFGQEVEVEIQYAGNPLGPDFDCTIVTNTIPNSALDWETSHGDTPCHLRLKPVLSTYYRSRGRTFNKKSHASLRVELRHEATGFSRDGLIKLNIEVVPVPK